MTNFELPKGMAGFVDHIGIAVVNLDESVKLYRDLLGLTLESIETVEREQVKVAMLKLDNSGGCGHRMFGFCVVVHDDDAKSQRVTKSLTT